MSAPVTTAASSAPVDAGSDNWTIVFRQFHKHKLGYVGLGVIAVIGTIAVFAPFLAESRPILMKKDGALSMPLLSNFKTADWLLLAGFFFLAGGGLVFRRLRKRGWERGRALRKIMAWSSPLWLALIVFCAARRPYLDSNDYTKIRSEFKAGDWAVWPFIPYAYDEQNLFAVLEKPGVKDDRGTHWLGTDATGRDILSRLVHGSRISMSVGFVAVGIYVLIGLIIGSLAGYYGGWVDFTLSRIIEIVICFPTLFLILTVLAVLPPSIFTIMVVIGITNWPNVARLVRAEFLKQKSLDYVSAARALGAAPRRVIFRHILPNAMAPIFVSATFGVAGAILIESALSFLGLGVPPPAPSWGQILSAGRDSPSNWWLTVLPGAAIFVTMTSFNLLGEALRDALDPRLKT